VVENGDFRFFPSLSSEHFTYFPEPFGEHAVLFIDRCTLIPAASTPVLVLQRNTAEAAEAE